MKKKSFLVKSFLSLTLAAFTLAVPFGMRSVSAAPNSIVTFPDASLKQALLSVGADQSGDGEITEGELALLTGPLSLKSLQIADLSGMEYAAGVTALDISDNVIRSISPLVGLPLTSLNVTNNYLDLADGGDDMQAITALSDAGCTVTFTPQKPIPVSSVSLNRSTLQMCPGDTAVLSASVVPSDASDQALTWSSDNPAAASVEGGTVTANAAGKAVITVTTLDGGFTAQCNVSVFAPVISSDAYAIEGGFLKNVTKMTSPGQLKANLKNEADQLFVYKPDGTLLESGYAGTGATVRLVVDGKVRNTLTVIVAGDTDGDGMVSIIDYTLIRLDLLQLKSLEGVYRTAADTDKDGTLSIIDYTLIRLDILALKPISAVTYNLPSVSDPRIRAFLDIALAQQGKPYIWSAEGPDGFDCSGYVYYCLTQVNYSSYYPYPAYKKFYRATASTYSAWPNWQRIDRNALQPGDLMFYFDDDMATIGHIGIYLGNGYHIHASSSYGCIIICRVEGWYNERLSHGMRVWN